MDAVLRVALPEWLGVKPSSSWRGTYDVTPLVEEWTLEFVDPVEELSRVAPQLLAQPGWRLCARATVTPGLHRVIRDAGNNGELQELLRPLRERAELRRATIPLLLGLAAVTAVEASLGQAAAGALDEVRKRAAFAARVAGDERASAERKSRDAGRHPATLEPLPPDAFGPSALT